LAELAASTHTANDVDEAVFMHTFIPRSLAEVPNCEADLKKLELGEQEVGHASAVASMLNRPTDSSPGTVQSDPGTVTGAAQETTDANETVNSEEKRTTASSSSSESVQEGDEGEGEDDDDDDGEEEEEEDPKKLGWRWDGDAQGRLPPAGSEARLSAKALKKVLKCCVGSLCLETIFIHIMDTMLKQ
jgi:hypothetical protein